MYNLGWFSTGRGEGSKGLLKAVQESILSGETEARIEFVFCSRERGETEATDAYLDMVEGYGIPLVSFSYQKYKKARGERNPDPAKPMPPWRLDYDREIMARLRDYHPDLSLLAGYMLICGEEMCQRYRPINLHPAAPGGPAGIWQSVIWQLIEEGAEESGVMMHLGIPALDQGAVVTYCTFSIRGGPFAPYWKALEGKTIDEVRRTEGEENPLFKLIRHHGVIREIPLIIATIQAFIRGSVRIGPDQQILDAAGKPIDGYDLTYEIDERLKKTGG